MMHKAVPLLLPDPPLLPLPLLHRVLLDPPPLAVLLHYQALAQEGMMPVSSYTIQSAPAIHSGTLQKNTREFQIRTFPGGTIYPTATGSNPDKKSGSKRCRKGFLTLAQISWHI